ncbi:MAG: hypothetical protein ABIF71_01235, partial [Planctomycetota bacterium]
RAGFKPAPTRLTSGCSPYNHLWVEKSAKPFSEKHDRLRIGIRKSEVGPDAQGADPGTGSSDRETAIPPGIPLVHRPTIKGAKEGSLVLTAAFFSAVGAGFKPARLARNIRRHWF